MTNEYNDKNKSSDLSRKKLEMTILESGDIKFSNFLGFEKGMFWLLISSFVFILLLWVYHNDVPSSFPVSRYAVLLGTLFISSAVFLKFSDNHHLFNKQERCFFYNRKLFIFTKKNINSKI